MNKILITCSFSPKSRNMVAVAVAFARALGAQMVFCHVADEDEELRQRILLMLTDLGVENPIVIIRPGNPDKAIRRLAKEIKADLIIAGALEHESTFVGILGSVARRIARKAPCSVLLLTSSAEHVGFKNIVVSVNYDAASKTLRDFTSRIALLWHATVHVVHTYDFCKRCLNSEEVGDAKRIEHYEEEAAAEESQRLKDFVVKGQWKGVSLRCCCLVRDGSELTNYATKVDADLVILPSPRRILFWERFFNPPAEVVLQDLPCSILLYKR